MQVRISDVVAYGVHQQEQRIIQTIMDSMKARQQNGLAFRDIYSKYVPFLNFQDPRNRTLVGDALGKVWNFCYDNELPLLNFLVVRGDTDLPGDAVMKGYQEKYGTLAEYDNFCRCHAELAEIMLRAKVISLV